MGNLVAIRDAYGNALARLGEANPKVVVLETDVGSSTKSAVFGSKYPERYFNIGISELDMNAMAAGFASCGLIPFTNTFAVFMTLRGGDPINSLICYDSLNVKLAGAYSGLSDSYDGASHHSTGDLSVLRALPNLTILSVCDPVETEKAVFAAAAHPGPVYLRLSRAAVPAIFDESYPFEIGKGVVLRDGNDVTIFATGYPVHSGRTVGKRRHSRPRGKPAHGQAPGRRAGSPLRGGDRGGRHRRGTQHLWRPGRRGCGGAGARAPHPDGICGHFHLHRKRRL